MARKTLKERRAEALADLDAAKSRLAKLEADAAERIGKLAIKAGLVDLDLSDDQLSTEFAAMAARFQGKAVSGGESSAKAGKG
ncbi:hypothetical protein GUF72_21470 [Xanthomonas citri pv. citri]|uniref:TraC family protein n=1 Tax=Xanthomonas TaxID=338 RepID=UPI00052BD4B9|nr:TraC family protein [Xanthomonas citri]MBD1487603.1 hypothetical protein [Xanthomonas citri pv. citri]MBD1528453.1 hypothetical protein [Xanthomonas citri pv. citri]MBD1536551.1 hypothetical protein [Xanthomonas citri pv. citri]MBD1563958.1 hypothetical protein [Xanthomonas citri pv. citri]MBD3977359.1 hypothetical protein [Xanthomonas citri pv. citri]